MNIELIRVTRHLFTRQGDAYLPVGVILKIARKIAQDGGQQAKDEPDELDNDETSEDVPHPSEWIFDDPRQNVTIGEKVVHFQGGTQYRLLKYAANGGTDLQEAWRVAWEYESPADWRIMKSMEKRINEKLSKVVGLVVVFKVTSKKIALYTLENKG